MLPRLRTAAALRSKVKTLLAAHNVRWMLMIHEEIRFGKSLYVITMIYDQLIRRFNLKRF